jgi:3-oxoacyl-[acyl-carrier-protein] synthase-3
VVIGAEVMSRVVDYDDRKTAGLFGDGAGAAVLGTGSGAAIGTTRTGSDGSRHEMIVATRERRLVEMDGHATFGAAVVTLSDLAHELCAAESLELADIDLFIFHQANGRILGSVADRLDLDPSRVFDCIGGIGNTSAASVPIALSMAREQGRLPEAGGRVLLAAFGAGLAWSGAILDFTESS